MVVATVHPEDMRSSETTIVDMANTLPQSEDSIISDPKLDTRKGTQFYILALLLELSVLVHSEDSSAYLRWN